MSSSETFKAVKLIHSISYGLAFISCLLLLKSAMSSLSPDQHYLVVTVTFLAARIGLYFEGLIRGRSARQFALYGMEYCAAGYLFAHAGGQGGFVILLFSIGFITMVTQFFTSMPRGEGLLAGRA